MMEKQWWFDLHTRRTKLTAFRSKLIAVRNEKAEALGELKVRHFSHMLRKVVEGICCGVISESIIHGIVV